MRKIQVGERDVGSAKAASQRTGVVRLRIRHMLVANLLLPVGVCNLGLFDTALGEVGISPDCGTVTV